MDEEQAVASEAVERKPTIKVCGQPCEVYSRVVGYLRPVQQWNKGKKAEYAQRKAFRQQEPSTEETENINGRMRERFGNF